MFARHRRQGNGDFARLRANDPRSAMGEHGILDAGRRTPLELCPNGGVSDADGATPSNQRPIERRAITNVQIDVSRGCNWIRQAGKVGHDLTLCSFAFGQRSASHGSALMNAASCRDGVSHSRAVDNIGPARGPSENLCGHEGIHQCIADERVQSPQLLHLLFVQAQTRHLLVLAADTLKPLRHG
ncbi:MAG: hypothetical protein WEB50_12790 [Vicinamibacterales bacterium]